MYDDASKQRTGHEHGREGHGHAHHHHGHGHGHGQGHGHEVTADSERRVFWVMLLTGSFMVVEVAGGILTGSLALLADAGHMLTDVGALALAWTAFRLGRRPADAQRSYGYHRFQVLAAFVNGLALFALVVWIAVEAVLRLMAPVEVMGEGMLAVATVGLAVNVVALWTLHRGEKGNLNLRGAAAHVLGDLLGSVAAIAAAVVIMATGWMPIDPLLSLLVCGLIVRSAWGVVREAAHILLEGTPAGIDPARIGAAVRSVPGVVDVHHVHAWSLTTERPLLTLHAVVEDGVDQHRVLVGIDRVLRDRFGIDHATVQIERGACISDAGLSGTGIAH